MSRLVLDGESILSREALHDIFKETLQFPEWYGRNLDALYDCLTGLQEETEIFLYNAGAMSRTLGPYADTLVKVLRRAAEENPSICLTVSGNSGDGFREVKF